MELTLERAKVLCLTVYSPPKSGFWSDVEETLLNCNGSFDHIILMGDLNINWGVTSTPLNILKDFLSYSSLVRVPFADTYHRLDGSHSTLDYICVSDLVKVSSYKQECIPSISMHDVIIVSLALSVPRREPMSVTGRCYRSFQLNHLLDDLSRVDWSAVTSLPDIDSKVSVLTNSLVSAYDKHAPIREFIIKKNSTSWITTQIKSLIHERNKAWKDFKKNGSLVARSHFNTIRNRVQTEIQNAKFHYFKEKLSSAPSTRDMWKIIDDLGLSKSPLDIQLPFNADSLNIHFVSTGNSTFNFSERPTVRDVVEAIDAAHSNAIGSDGVQLRQT